MKDQCLSPFYSLRPCSLSNLAYKLHSSPPDSTIPTPHDPQFSSGTALLEVSIHYTDIILFYQDLSYPTYENPYSSLEIDPVSLLPSQETACTLYKGSRKQAERMAYVEPDPWTLGHQYALVQKQDCRQTRRQEDRMRQKVTRWLGYDPFNPEEPVDSNGKAPKSPTKRDRVPDSQSPPEHQKKKKAKGEGGGGKFPADGDGGGGKPPGGGNGGGEKPPTAGVGAAGGQQKRKVSRKASDRQVEPNLASATGDHALGDLVSDLVQSTDPVFKNARRIATKLKDCKLLRVVKPFTPEASEARLQQIVSAPNPSGRDIRPLNRKRDIEFSKTPDKHRWVLKFSEGATKTEAKKTSLRIPFSILAKDASMQDQNALHEELARIYRNLPWDVEGLNQMVKQQMVVVAVSNVFAQPLQVDEVTHSDTITYQTKVHYIDAKTAQHKRINISATCTDAAMAGVVVPRLPFLNIRKTSDQSIISMTPDNPHHVAPPKLKTTLTKSQTTSKQSQYKAENAVYWIAAQLQGLVATEDRMKNLHAMYRAQIGLQKSYAMKEGVYGGKSDLYSAYKDRGTSTTMVLPTKMVHEDLGTGKSDLRLVIFSLNSTRATPVMDTILQLFCNGSDIRYAWLEAAKIADYVNAEIADGVPPTSHCDCDDSRVETERHACEGCTKPVLCKTRAYDSLGRLVCPPCQQRDEFKSYGGRPLGESLAAYLANACMRRNFVKECAVRGKNPNDKRLRQIFDAASKQVKSSLPAAGVVKDLPAGEKTHYVDQWTGKKFDVSEERGLVGVNPSRRRYVPAGITVDTIHRQGAPQNDHLKHSSGNLAITSNACQMAKGSFNNGVLHEIGEFKRLTTAKQASDASRKALIEKLTAMAEVSCKRAYITNGQGDAESKYRKIIAESIAGRTTPNEPGPWEQRARRYVSKTVPPYQPDMSLWEDDVWSRAQECAKSMETYFGITLHKLQDGTRWMGTDYSNPKDLDRNGIMLLCQERLARMRLVGNKKWETKDTAETLYREIIFQYCCSATQKPELRELKEKYGDRLGLPLVLWKHSPLRFSVAHRAHGSGMFTGWPSSDATDVQERIDNDDDNKMLIESWYMNSAKMDMADEYYEQLDDILKSAKILDTNIYNPGTATTFHDAIPSTDETIVIDDFDGAVFDESAVVTEGGDDGADAADSGDEDRRVQPLVAGGDPQPGDSDGGKDEEMGETPATGVLPDSGADDANPDLQDAISQVYSLIMANDDLKTYLVVDRDFTRLLAHLQRAADGDVDGDAREYFDECMGQVYERYITPTQGS